MTEEERKEQEEALQCWERKIKTWPPEIRDLFESLIDGVLYIHWLQNN